MNDFSPNLHYSRIFPRPGLQRPNPRIQTAMISRTNRWPRITGTPFGLIRIWSRKCKIYAFFQETLGQVPGDGSIAQQTNWGWGWQRWGQSWIWGWRLVCTHVLYNLWYIVMYTMYCARKCKKEQKSIVALENCVHCSKDIEINQPCHDLCLFCTFDPDHSRLVALCVIC